MGNVETKDPLKALRGAGQGEGLLDRLLQSRQLALQQALGYPSPEYIHLPLVLNPDGTKLGKRDGALPLPTLDDTRIRETLAAALRHLGIDVAMDEPRRMLEDATLSLR